MKRVTRQSKIYPMSRPKEADAIVLFAKAPISGMVKTRLQPQISPGHSAMLQEAMIKDAIAKMDGIKKVEKFIYFWPKEEKSIFESLVANLSFKLCCQRGVDLGEKMENSFKYLFRQGFSKILIIGVDSPTFPVEYINKAYEKLNKTELVIGPSADGGYYLIGLKEKAYPLFSGVEWGSSKVLLQTEELIRKHKIKLSLLPVHYDIDTFEDIIFLRTHLRLLKDSNDYIPVHTMKLLDKIL